MSSHEAGFTGFKIVSDQARDGRISYIIADMLQVKQQNQRAVRISFRTPSPATVRGENLNPLPANNHGEGRVNSNVLPAVSDLLIQLGEPSTTPASVAGQWQAHEHPRTPLAARVLDDGLFAEPVVCEPSFDWDWAIDMGSPQGFIELGDVGMDIESISGAGIGMCN